MKRIINKVRWNVVGVLAFLVAIWYIIISALRSLYQTLRG